MHSLCPLLWFRHSYNSKFFLLHHSGMGKVGLKKDKALSSSCGDLSGRVLEAIVSISAQLSVT